nr:putative reverse transcriptase domain-containing protein [Tanacetum cinerariifolium]
MTKSEQKRTKDGKRGKARQCQRPITVKKAENKRKYKFKGTKNANPTKLYLIKIKDKGIKSLKTQLTIQASLEKRPEKAFCDTGFIDQNAVTYRLKLPQELSCVHDTFHVSNLKKCLAEPDVQVPLDEIGIYENLYFVEEPIEIVERDVKMLKQRRIPLVKVRWNSRQQLSIPGNVKISSGRNIRICSLNPYLRQVSQLEP